MDTHDTQELAIFNGVRKVWFENEWWFSVVDVVGALTDSPKPRNYWAVLKSRLRDEGADQSITNCKQLKMPSLFLLAIISSSPVDVSDHLPFSNCGL